MPSTIRSPYTLHLQPDSAGGAGHADGAGHDVPGRLVFLPQVNSVVSLQARTATGWVCRIVADTVGHGGHTITLPADTISDGCDRIHADPGQPGRYALAWQTLLWRRYADTHPTRLGWAAATRIRPAASLAIDLDHPNIHHLVTTTRIRAMRLHFALRTLVAARYLTPDPPSAGTHGGVGGWGTYRLTITDEHLT